jgi:hypothetical protein
VTSPYPTQVEAEPAPLPLPIVERMDTAIRETSTMMGAMVSEFLRRTLRGSVVQVFEELHTVVADKVDATIAERTPGIERAAAEVAEHAARGAATEVAVGEVRALEERTHHAHRELAGQMQDGVRQARAATEELGHGLVQQISATERKAAAAQAEIAQQVSDLLERSRKAAAHNKARLDEVDGRARTLEIQLRDEKRERCSERAALQRDWHAQVQALEQRQGELQQLVQELRTRLTELEKPRGLRGLLGRMFSRKEGAVEEGEAEEQKS